MTLIPWTERAILSCLDIQREGLRTIVVDDRLSAAAEHLSHVPTVRLCEFRVAMPDRQMRPYAYSGPALTDLLKDWQAEKWVRRFKH